MPKIDTVILLTFRLDLEFNQAQVLKILLKSGRGGIGRHA